MILLKQRFLLLVTLILLICFMDFILMSTQV